MYFRVTSQMQATDSIAYMQQQNSALNQVDDALSSGIQLQMPSDNPSGYVALAQANTSQLQYATYGQTMTNANSTLSSSTTALQNIYNVLTQATTSATTGADATTNSTGYQALAVQVNGLISELMDNVNQSVGGTYLFGGEASTTQPFTLNTDSQGNPTSVTYNGSTQSASALIGPNQTVNTLSAGNQVFQQSGSDVFQALIGLYNNLTNPSLTQSQSSMSQALNQSLTQISSAATAVQNAEAEQSSNIDTLNALQSQVQNLQTNATEQAGNIGDTDDTSAIVQMEEDQTSLQASMEVTSKLMQTSLLNFLQ